MTLAKKNSKQKSCEINPEVKDQMIAAFDLLEGKKTDEAIEAFKRIINESSVINVYFRQFSGAVFHSDTFCSGSLITRKPCLVSVDVIVRKTIIKKLWNT